MIGRFLVIFGPRVCSFEKSKTFAPSLSLFSTWQTTDTAPLLWEVQQIKPTNYMSIWRASMKVSMLQRTRVKRPTQHHQRQLHVSLEHTKYQILGMEASCSDNLLLHCSCPPPTHSVGGLNMQPYHKNTNSTNTTAAITDLKTHEVVQRSRESWRTPPQTTLPQPSVWLMPHLHEPGF